MLLRGPGPQSASHACPFVDVDVDVIHRTTSEGATPPSTASRHTSSMTRHGVPHFIFCRSPVTLQFARVFLLHQVSAQGFAAVSHVAWLLFASEVQRQCPSQGFYQHLSRHEMGLPRMGACQWPWRHQGLNHALGLNC